MSSLERSTRSRVLEKINDWRGPVFSLLLLTLVAGCGGGVVDPPVLAVVPVTGKVKWGSETPVGARVTLIPAARTEGAVNSTGVVGADGSFKISSYGTDDGAPVGDYAVVVEWFKVVETDGGTGRGPNVLPPAYANSATSPVKVTIKDGSNELPPIEIPKS